MTKFLRDQLEIMAVACCYAGFISAHGTSQTPLGYWRKVSDENKVFYRKQAQALIVLVQNMPTVQP